MKSEELPKERTNGNKPASDMTMREVIATEAMLGILANDSLVVTLSRDVTMIASAAIQQTDELIKQLEHGSK